MLPLTPLPLEAAVTTVRSPDVTPPGPLDISRAPPAPFADAPPEKRISPPFPVAALDCPPAKFTSPACPKELEPAVMDTIPPRPPPEWPTSMRTAPALALVLAPVFIIIDPDALAIALPVCTPTSPELMLDPGLAISTLPLEAFKLGPATNKRDPPLPPYEDPPSTWTSPPKPSISPAPLPPLIVTRPPDPPALLAPWPAEI